MCGHQHRQPLEEQRGRSDSHPRFWHRIKWILGGRIKLIYFTQKAEFAYWKAPFALPGAAIKPRQRPRIVAAPQNITVSLHQTVVLECVATGNPRPIVSWSRADSKPIDVYNAKVLGNGNLVITDVSSKHSGIYLCRATTPGTRNYTVAAANLTVQGTVQAALAVLDYSQSTAPLNVAENTLHHVSLHPPSVPPSIVEKPESQTRPRAGTARFLCQAEGVPTPHISWLKNGEEVHLNGRIKMYNRYFTWKE